MGNIYLYIHNTLRWTIYPSGGWAGANHPTCTNLWRCVAGCCDQFCGTAAREFTLGVAGAGKNWDPINLEFATSRDRVHPKQVANIEGNTIVSWRFVFFWFGLNQIAAWRMGSQDLLGDTCLITMVMVSALRIGVGSLPNGLYKWLRRTYMGLILTTYKSDKSWDDPPCCCFFSDSWTVLQQKIPRQIMEISTEVTPKCFLI